MSRLLDAGLPYVYWLGWAAFIAVGVAVQERAAIRRWWTRHDVTPAGAYVAAAHAAERLRAPRRVRLQAGCPETTTTTHKGIAA